MPSSRAISIFQDDKAAHSGIPFGSFIDLSHEEYALKIMSVRAKKSGPKQFLP